MKMTYILTITVISLISFAFYSFNKEIDDDMFFSFVEVANETSSKIHASVNFGDKTEDFGVIPAHLSKTIGFNNYKIGKSLIVRWDADDGILNQTATFDTKDLFKFSGSDNKLYISYVGTGKWIIYIYDNKGISLIKDAIKSCE